MFRALKANPIVLEDFLVVFFFQHSRFKNYLDYPLNLDYLTQSWLIFDFSDSFLPTFNLCLRGSRSSSLLLSKLTLM